MNIIVFPLGFVKRGLSFFYFSTLKCLNKCKQPQQLISSLKSHLTCLILMWHQKFLFFPSFVLARATKQVRNKEKQLYDYDTIYATE